MQCSTIVRNTVVRATIKVNGKPQILGTRSFQTPESIDLKFDLALGGLTLLAKNGTNRQGRRGKGVKYDVQLGIFNLGIFLSFFTFLVKLWRTHFWKYRRIFCTG